MSRKGRDKLGRRAYDYPQHYVFYEVMRKILILISCAVSPYNMKNKEMFWLLSLLRQICAVKRLPEVSNINLKSLFKN